MSLLSEEAVPPRIPSARIMMALRSNFIRRLRVESEFGGPGGVMIST